MKIRINTLIIVLTIVIIQSCQHKKDDPGISIVGSWKPLNEEYLECPNTADNKVLDCNTAVYGFCNTYIFKSDGTFDFKRNKDGAYMGDGTYFFGNSQLSILFTNNPGNFVDIIGQPVTISGSTLTYVSGDAGSCKIKMTYQKV